MIDVINADLDRCVAWGDSNKTLFDPGKTYSMVVSRKHKAARFNVDGLQLQSDNYLMCAYISIYGLDMGLKVDSIIYRSCMTT